jgi:hypothetical protein
MSVASGAPLESANVLQRLFKYVSFNSRRKEICSVAPSCTSQFAHRGSYPESSMGAQFRAVRIRSRDEFDWLIEHMTHEAYRVRDNWDFWGAMEKAFDEYSIELNQTPAFWEFTRRAHQDAVALRLGRLYDPHATATSLGNLLQTMKENAARAGTLFPGPVADLDSTELDSEIAGVSDEDPIVAKLLLIRNEYLAHRGTRHVTKGTFASLPTLERDEISTLITRAIDLLRKYRERLGYRLLSWGDHEVEEFQRLLALVRAGRNSTMSDS